MTLDAPTERIERFHRVLVERIRDMRPEYLDGPFTVAEIYQDLVPYATHRDRLGVEMNGDYEDVLLRLLAGEGDYLILESSHARDRLRDELRSPNPDTGVYREFAAVDMRLRPHAIPDAPGGADTAPTETARGGNGERPAETAGGDPADGRGALEGHDAVAEAAPDVVEVGDLAPSPAPASSTVDAEASRRPEKEASRRPEEEASRRPEEEDAPVVAPAGSGGTQCAWCREELPLRDNMNYCPFCGIDVHVVPCRSCGEALEPAWRFCIACGAETAAA